MDMDIYSPSIPKFTPNPKTTDSCTVTNGSSSKQKLFQLMDEKDKVEHELKALGQVLDSHGVNMNTSLTTFDGYPRDDIDIPQIRTTRSRIIYLRNDYKALMNKIEVALHSYHAELANAPSTPPPIPQTATINPSDDQRDPVQLAIGQVDVDVPFAVIDVVSGGGPSEQSGLKVGDMVVRFGDIHALNHAKLSKVAELVQRSEGSTINVQILRRRPGEDNPTEGTASGHPEAEILKVSLVPRAGWGGRGLLGCHLQPIL